MEFAEYLEDLSCLPSIYMNEFYDEIDVIPEFPPEVSRADNPSDKYVCTICSMGFSRRYHLIDHRRSHVREKPFTCKHCGSTFGHKSGLNAHVKIHVGDRRHACHICEKSYVTTSGLKVHLLSHTGEKNHVCGLCSKAFTTRSALNRHIRYKSCTK